MLNYCGLEIAVDLLPFLCELSSQSVVVWGNNESNEMMSDIGSGALQYSYRWKAIRLTEKVEENVKRRGMKWRTFNVGGITKQVLSSFDQMKESCNM